MFDIDPYIYSGKEAKGAEPELNTIAFEKGKEVAFWLRELLHGMSLEPIVKTSGKTGLHVFVPIRRTHRLRRGAAGVGAGRPPPACALHPKDITLEWSVPKRTGKIFMDYNMNVRGKTLNVAYSPRGAPGAPVSMPLTWEELADGASARFPDHERAGAPGADRRPLAATRLSASRASRRRSQAARRPESARMIATQRSQPRTSSRRQSWLHDRSRRLTISFGLVSIPVKLYSATEASKAISFNLLHKACGSRLKQQYICVKEEVRSRARTWSRATSSPRTST